MQWRMKELERNGSRRERLHLICNIAIAFLLGLWPYRAAQWRAINAVSTKIYITGTISLHAQDFSGGLRNVPIIECKVYWHCEKSVQNDEHHEDVPPVQIFRYIHLELTFIRKRT